MRDVFPAGMRFSRKVWEWYFSLAFIGDPELSLYKENPHWTEGLILHMIGLTGSAVVTGMIDSSFFDPKTLKVFTHAVMPGTVFMAFFGLMSLLARGRYSVWYVSISSVLWPVSFCLLPWFIPRARAWRRAEVIREVMES